MGMRMHNPPHPGEIIRKLCLEPLGLSVTEASARLGISRKALSELLNGHVGVSPEMALRLARAFDTTLESWLLNQMEHDLWAARQKRPRLRVRRIKARAARATSSKKTQGSDRFPTR